MILNSKLNEFAQRWTRFSEIPLAALGLVYLAAYSLQVVFRDIGVLYAQLELASQVIWGVFALDITIRFFSASSIGKFLRSNWLEVFALAVPFMRFLRVFRVVLALRAIRGFLSNRASATGAYLLLLVPLTWFSGAIAVLDAESESSEASIQTLSEALWWSLSTITTVGYGDTYPVTLEGKLVAAVLMVSGIALFSAGAGIFASWMLGGRKTT